jgi:hypothetical protein
MLDKISPSVGYKISLTLVIPILSGTNRIITPKVPACKPYIELFRYQIVIIDIP